MSIGGMAPDLADSGSSGDKAAVNPGGRVPADYGHASSSHIWLLHDALNRVTTSLCSEEHLLQATWETAA